MSGSAAHFEGKAELYNASRPDYPPALLRHLADEVMRAPARGGVMDVGSGTGIFTRQLRGVLPEEIGITGIEPSSDMRAKATAKSPGGGIVYANGTAEALPGGPGDWRAMIAAAAAHHFDRPAFYREVHRLLPASGLLAIIEYLRDAENSPAAEAQVRFVAKHGGPEDYGRPDYAAELAASGLYTAIEEVREQVVLPLTAEQYVGAMLTSSHARPAIEALGTERAERMLRDMAKRLTNAEGHIPFGYLFRLVTARRA